MLHRPGGNKHDANKRTDYAYKGNMPHVQRQKLFYVKKNFNYG